SPGASRADRASTPTDKVRTIQLLLFSGGGAPRLGGSLEPPLLLLGPLGRLTRKKPTGRRPVGFRLQPPLLRLRGDGDRQGLRPEPAVRVVVEVRPARRPAVLA